LYQIIAKGLIETGPLRRRVTKIDGINKSDLSVSYAIGEFKTANSQELELPRGMRRMRHGSSSTNVDFRP
jgi:hypothetical protein